MWPYRQRAKSRIDFHYQSRNGRKKNITGARCMPEDRRLVPELVVEENILLPALATGAADAKERLEHIYALMPEVTNFRRRRALELSGGQQKMVALARALMAVERGAVVLA
jgi:branched-chain amino acid transport system ATP-binding protein